MKQAKNQEIGPKPARWYAPDEKVQKRLEALGVPKAKIYDGWTAVQHWSKVIMRPGEFLGVLDGLKAFGATKPPVKEAVARFHKQGATIIDIETGQDSRNHALDMLDALTRPSKPSPAYLAQLQAEKREAWRLKHRVMPKEKAFVIWRDPTLTITQKLRFMHGWTKDLAFREFGPTGKPSGRPRTKEG